MRFCLFLTFWNHADPAARLSQAGLRVVCETLPHIDKLAAAAVHTPARTSDPFLKETPLPLLSLQLYFEELPDLEQATRSVLMLLAANDRGLIELADAVCSQQAMLVRSFAVPEPDIAGGLRQTRCSYLVAYQGEAEDLNAWLDHYVEKHTGMMARLPGIRALEVYTRVDAISHLPWRRDTFMQRNRVMFDDPAALTAALASPLRAEMRADFHSFPEFSGTNSHYPMLTRIVSPMTRERTST